MPDYKLSAALAQRSQLALRPPPEQTPGDAACIAAVPASIAWNRSLLPSAEWPHDSLQARLQKLQAEKPAAIADLKSADGEALMRELLAAKRKLYPYDQRLVIGCQITAAGNFSVLSEREEDWKARKEKERLLGHPIPPGTPLHELQRLGQKPPRRGR